MNDPKRWRNPEASKPRNGRGECVVEKPVPFANQSATRVHASALGEGCAQRERASTAFSVVSKD